MEKLCLRCGAKFSDDIDLLSGDFAATGLDRYQKTFIKVCYKIVFVRNVSGISGIRSMLSMFLLFTVKTDRISWNGLRNYYGAKG